MKGLLRLSRGIDKLNTGIGHVVAWALLAAVLISAANAIVRKVFNTSSNSWLEIQWILFGAVFLLCSAWTLLSNEHIRIDIVNNMLPKRARNVIDVFGHLFFLLPVTFVLAYLGWPFFWLSLLAERAIDQRRRPARLSGKVSDPARLHAAARAGPLGADQAHRHHAAASSRTRYRGAGTTMRRRPRRSV